jgi:hypothetical protein
MKTDYYNETPSMEFDFEEFIQQFWESPEEWFRQEPQMADLLPDNFFHQESRSWATDTPLFAPAEGWPMYLQMVIFSLFFMTIILYPISNIILTMITKRTVRHTIAAIGPAIMGLGWIIGISPSPENSALITITGLLLSLSCVLYEVIRRQMTVEQEHDVKSGALTPLRPILIIGLGILFWHLQLWFFGYNH